MAYDFGNNHQDDNKYPERRAENRGFSDLPSIEEDEGSYRPIYSYDDSMDEISTPSYREKTWNNREERKRYRRPIPLRGIAIGILILLGLIIIIFFRDELVRGVFGLLELALLVGGMILIFRWIFRKL